MKTLALFVGFSCFSLAMSCSCLLQAPNETFCSVDWVSHVKVTKLYNQPPPQPAPGKDWVTYLVEHIKIFKSPVNNLPMKIRTSAYDSACGISLDVGKEYLLSGNMGPANRTLTAYTCNQVMLGNPLPDDVDYESLSTSFEWKYVPEDVIEEFETLDC